MEDRREFFFQVKKKKNLHISPPNWSRKLISGYAVRFYILCWLIREQTVFLFLPLRTTSLKFGHYWILIRGHPQFPTHILICCRYEPTRRDWTIFGQHWTEHMISVFGKIKIRNIWHRRNWSWWFSRISRWIFLILVPPLHKPQVDTTW